MKPKKRTVRGMNRFQLKCNRLLRERVAPGAKILEISCGRAAILADLMRDGYHVTGTNYSVYDDLPEGVDVRVGVDVRHKLPFDDQSFDALILADVIEHVSDHMSLIAEMARVLKVGGHAFVLTPNLNRLSSRLHYFCTGFFKIKRGFTGFDVPPERAFVFHNYGPHLPVFLYQMHSHGFDFVGLEGEGLKVKNIILGVLFYPLVWTATLWKTAVRERFLRRTKGGQLLRKALTSFPGLCAESWVAVHCLGEPRSPITSTRLPDWHAVSPPHTE